MLPIIGLSGCSRCGKDTFFNALNAIRPGAIRLSIGDIIRRDCANIISEKFGIDVRACTPEQKEIIRPILVGYGLAQRKASLGTYFINQLSNLIKEYEAIELAGSQRYFVITDIRFDEYPYDEIDWVKSRDGIIVHISRKDGRSCVQPINDAECENDPRIQSRADYLISWDSNPNIEYHQSYAKRIADYYLS